jgi:hypothetical protein
MHADIGSDAAALMDITLPGSIIPLAPGSNVSQVHILHLVGRTLIHLLFESYYGFVKAELEDIVSLVTGFLFHLLEGVDVIRI